MPVGLPGHERIEDRLLELLGNAGAVVLDLQADSTSTVLLAADPWKFDERARAEDHSAARADRLHRVARDVQERLDHLIPVDVIGGRLGS